MRRESPNQYDTTPEELAFIQAIYAHKAKTGRAFPAWTEVLGILRSLGWTPPAENVGARVDALGDEGYGSL